MYSWAIFWHNQDTFPTGTSDTAAGAKADVLAAIASGGTYGVAYNWEVYDSTGAVVDSSGGGPGGDEVKFKVDVPGQWASGFIYNSLADAKAGLEAQRGSFPAGKSFAYTISDRNGVADSGTVSSTAYEPDDINYYIRIHNELTNTDEPDDNTPYSTLAKAKAALPAKKSALKAISPAQGKYDWWILKASAAVADGVFIWGFDDGDGGTPPAGRSPWLGLIVIAIIIVAVLYFLPKIGPSKEIIAPIEKVV
jgi:hypothetical protein